MKAPRWSAGLLLLGLGLAGPGELRAEHPNHARGFVPGHAFQSGDIEHVNLENGNLNLTLPIGPSYPLGPSLSYGLTLTYSGNLWTWEEETDPLTGETYLQAEPRPFSNAGLGWDLDLTRLISAGDPGNESKALSYQTPDQALHELHPGRLHPDGQSFDGLQFTQDGSYVRYSPSAGRVETPDGTIRTFGPDGISRVEDRYGHYLAVQYLARDAQGDPLDWKLTDSYGREHHVLFARRHGRLVVTEVRLARFGGGSPAVYAFHYADPDPSLPRACNEPVSCSNSSGFCGDRSNVTVPLLTEVALPDGSSFKMPVDNYHIDSSAQCSERAINGQLERLELPTGGAFEWDWQVWVFPKASGNLGGVLHGRYPGNPFSLSVGLAERRWMKPDGGELGAWIYSPKLQQDPTDPDARELVVTVTTRPPGDSSKHYFSVYPGHDDPTISDPPGGWTKDEYGLPFTRRVTDGTSPARYLSSQVFDKAGTLLRTTYVRYERSGSTPANPRLVSERTVYADDAGRHADLAMSGFDGLGHYRTQTYSGNFTGANARTVTTDFNPGRSVSNVPGAGEPWILGTYDLRQTTEGGRTVTEEADFEAATGFLHRLRRRVGAACGGHDVVVERTRFRTPSGQSPIPEAGFVDQEAFYGGDGQTLGCGGLAGLALPAQPVYRQKHTYTCGSLATSRWFTPGGVALSFFSLDQDVDCSTGLVAKSRDPSGLATTLTYDSSGRLTKADLPAGEGADTVYTYSNRSATLPARVTIQEKDGATVLTEGQVRFDDFGRAAEERRTMPDGTTAVQSTAWNSRGWIDQRSEWHQDGATAPQTLFRQYDPFGRPGTVTLPDGRVVSLDYSGVGSRSVTVQVATSLASATKEPILAGATTTEVYDRFGRLARLTEPGGVRTSYTYGPQDELTLVQQNDLGSPVQTRSFAYDGRGFLTSETHPELGTAVTYSGYDPLGNPGEISRGDQDLSYAYDAAARLTKITGPGCTDPDTHLAVDCIWKSWTYATANFQAGHWSNGKLAAASRLNRLPYPPAPSIVIEPTVTESYTYGGVGGRISHVTTRVEKVGDPDLGTQPVFGYSLAYDALGEVTSRTYPDCSYLHCSEATASHVVTQGFTAGLLTSVPQFASAITYHPNGLWAHVVHTNGVTDVQEADVSGLARPGRLSTSGASENFDSGAIAYDGAGNVTKMGADRYVYDLLSRVGEAQVEVPHAGCGQVTLVQGKTDTTTKTYQSCGTVQAGPSYTVGGTGNVTLTAGHEVVFASGFSVASGGRLAAGVDPALDPAGQPTAAGQTYTFDRFGNLTQVVTSHEGQADPPATIGTFSNTNRLSAGGYDDAGNLVSFPGVAWSYDPFNMMTQEASSIGSHFDFVYGPGDERLWTIDWSAGAAPSNWRETWTLRDLDGSPLRQYVSIGGNNARANWQAANPDFPRDYAWRGGSLLASVTQAGVTRHDHLDHLGSPRIVTDAAGKTLARHLYFPFGQEATDPDQDNLALKFTGHERDDLDPGGTSYDLDYMHARYYSPLVGRFLSFDPVGGTEFNAQTWNRYSYAVGNPLKYTDPTGESPWDVVGQIGQDYLQCLINGGCDSIEVVDQGPGFNPLTGVQGLGNLISGSAFTLGLSGALGGDPTRDFTLSSGERMLSSIPAGLAQTSGDAISGFGDVLSFGLTDLYRTEAGLENTINEDSGAYLTGEVAGVVHGIALSSLSVARAAGVQTKIAIHEAHHVFPRLGGRRLAHIQLNIWRAGVKGSGRAFRIALPWR